MAAFSTVRSTTFQPKTSPKYLLIELCQTKTAIFRWFFYWFACVSSGTGNIKNRWNNKALEDDNNFLAEQDKIEASEPEETQANQ